MKGSLISKKLIFRILFRADFPRKYLVMDTSVFFVCERIQSWNKFDYKAQCNFDSVWFLCLYMAHKSIQKYSCSVNVAFRSLSPEIEILVHNVFKSCVIILFIIKIFARLNILNFKCKHTKWAARSSYVWWEISEKCNKFDNQSKQGGGFRLMVES